MTKEHMEAYQQVAQHLELQKRESLVEAARRRLAAAPNDRVALEIERACGGEEYVQWAAVVRAARLLTRQPMLKLVRG